MVAPSSVSALPILKEWPALLGPPDTSVLVAVAVVTWRRCRTPEGSVPKAALPDVVVVSMMLDLQVQRLRLGIESIVLEASHAHR